MLQAVRMFTVAAVRGASAGLYEGRIPRFRAECAQSRGGVKRARAHLHVVRLQDQAAAFAPIVVELEDHALEAERLHLGLGHARALADGGAGGK